MSWKHEKKAVLGGPRLVCDRVSAGGCWRAPEWMASTPTFRVGIFGVGLLVFGAHAGFLSEVRCLRRVETPWLSRTSWETLVSLSIHLETH
jgi:hypothetical protein